MSEVQSVRLSLSSCMISVLSLYESSLIHTQDATPHKCEDGLAES